MICLKIGDKLPAVTFPADAFFRLRDLLCDREGRGSGKIAASPGTAKIQPRESSVPSRFGQVIPPFKDRR